MTEQLSFHNEPGWRSDQRQEHDIPKEFSHKPALELCWRGLVISISEGCMTRKQAYEMLARLDQEDGQSSNVLDLDSYRRDEPPDIVA
jgi:hypothetical protein